MTTFAFANVEASFDSTAGTTFSHGEQTVYTVPAGKLAKIKFDSYHMSIDTTNRIIYKMYWTLYSQNSSSTTARKHMVGEGFNSDSGVRTMSFYNPADFTTVPFDKGGNTTAAYGKIMNAAPENWITNNVPHDGFDASLRMNTWDTQGYGAFVHGPETFFLGAGEVLKLRTKSELNAGADRYTNIRCAVWLEDV